MATGTAEVRKHRRYKLSLPVRVWAKAQSALPIETSSKNISANGIYFTVSQDLKLQSELKLEIALPPELTGGENVRLRCRAKIARVEQVNSHGKIGVGAIIESYQFVRAARPEARRGGLSTKRRARRSC